MPWWVEKPARALSGLEGLAVAIAFVYPIAGWLLSTVSVGRLFVGVVLVMMTPIAVIAWARERPDGLGHLLERSRRGWIAPLSLAFLFLSGTFGFSGWSRVPGAIAGVAALVAGVWAFAIARATRHWISGRLERTEDLRIRCGGATYVLARAPRGARLGGWLTFPSVDIAIDERGPYRSGRPRGRAPSVLLLPLATIRRRLHAYGGAFLLWGIVCLVAALAE